MAETKNVYQRLLEVQAHAVAPRTISGKFGKARSAEQILEAYKPVCRKHGLYLFTDDEMIELNGRNYVRATATVINADTPDDSHSAHAYAWENVVEKSASGNAILDTSQVTGKTSSYAKKYALQNLFAIDDTKDADQDETSKRQPASPVDHVKTVFPEAEVKHAQAQEKRPTGLVSDKQLSFIQANFTELKIMERADKLAYVTGVIKRDIDSSTELTLAEAKKVIDRQLADKEGGEYVG